MDFGGIWSELWRVNTPISQVFLSFALGVLFSPWSYGLFWLTVYLIFYELISYIVSPEMDNETRMVDYPDGLYYAWVRLGVLCASYSGYVIGMTICQRDPIDC